MSLEENGELGDSGDGTSYHVFREAEFSTRTGRKIRKIKTSYLSSRWGEKSGTRNDGSVRQEREKAGEGWPAVLGGTGTRCYMWSALGGITYFLYPHKQ